MFGPAVELWERCDRSRGRGRGHDRNHSILLAEGPAVGVVLEMTAGCGWRCARWSLLAEVPLGESVWGFAAVAGKRHVRLFSLAESPPEAAEILDQVLSVV